MDEPGKKKGGSGDGGGGEEARGIYSLGDDLLGNILSRLPAAPFASACASCRAFRGACGRILCRPKLLSALSMNPSPENAVEEVFDKLLSEPVRPHFAIVCVNQSFELKKPFDLITKRLGKGVPIICYRAVGIVGSDVETGELKKVVREWKGFGDESRGILVTFGFVPGLKVTAIPMAAQESEPGQLSKIDSFFADIREFTLSVSKSNSPSAILMFGTEEVDTRLVIEKMDLVFNKKTVITGVKGCSMLFTSGCADTDRQNPPVLVSLVFSKDKFKAPGIGETHFSLTLSTALAPVGKSFNAASLSVFENVRYGTSLQGQRHGRRFIGPEILDQAKYEAEEDNDKFKHHFYCGVLEQRKFSTETREGKIIRHFNLHPVNGDPDRYHLTVRGHGINGGDRFCIYAPSLKAVAKSRRLVDGNFRDWKDAGTPSWKSTHPSAAQTQKDEVFGGLMFTCAGRVESFFGDSDADIATFTKNFPNAAFAGTYAGTYSGGEIARGVSTVARGVSTGVQDRGVSTVARGVSTGVHDRGFCYVHAFSAVYLLMSYAAPH